MLVVLVPAVLLTGLVPHTPMFVDLHNARWVRFAWAQSTSHAVRGRWGAVVVCEFVCECECVGVGVVAVV